MKHKFLALLILLMFSLSAPAQRKPRVKGLPDSRQSADASQMIGLRRLRAASSVPVELSVERGAIRSAKLSVPVPRSVGLDADKKALWFLKEHRRALRLNDPANDLQLTRRSRNNEFLFFRRRHLGIPVFPGGVGVHLNGSRVSGLSGNYVTEIQTSPTPRLTAERGEEIAQSHNKDARHAHGGGAPHVETTLRYINLALLGLADRKTRLAWRVHFPNKSLYIDAHTGALLFTQSHVMNAFDLELDNSNGNGPRHGGACGGEQDWFDELGPIPDANPRPDAEGWLAFQNIKTVDSYFRNKFGRDGYDGEGDDVEIYVHVGHNAVPFGNNWQNAHYLNCCDLFEFGEGFPILDVMAHEFTHGVTAHEADLIYSFESGALNESFSDIFGQFVDNNDWLMGENTPGSGAPVGGIPGCVGTPARRDLSNPPCQRQPDHYSNRATNLEDDLVHINSGIHNKAAFLITAGGMHHNFSVDGIGQLKAERLFYTMLTAGLSDSSQMIDARNVALFWASRWADSGGTHGFTLNDVCQIRNAYAAVGLGEGDRDCDGIGDNSDGFNDSDRDSVSDPFDNCITVPNLFQSDVDEDGQGDACDTDIDNDGRLNRADNCPNDPNPGQANGDGDQLGDACDHSDTDYYEDAVDNCPHVSNDDQLDTDLDGQGDACDPDIDNDGRPNRADNCPLKANGLQEDSDGDHVGNACDLCASLPTSDNRDTDGDGFGNPCDTDDDGDGWADIIDNCPLVWNDDQLDTDKNGVGFACDAGERAEFADKAFTMTDAPLFLPAPICPQCGFRIPNNYEELIIVEAPVGFDVRLVNSEGRSVADGQRNSSRHVMRFQPPPHSSTAARMKISDAQFRSGRALQFGGSPAHVAGPTAMRPGPTRLSIGRMAPDELRYYLLVTPPPNFDSKYAHRVSVKLRGGIRGYRR